jgi:hypothetical protein
MFKRKETKLDKLEEDLTSSIPKLRLRSLQAIYQILNSWDEFDRILELCRSQIPTIMVRRLLSQPFPEPSEANVIINILWRLATEDRAIRLLATAEVVDGLLTIASTFPDSGQTQPAVQGALGTLTCLAGAGGMLGNVLRNKRHLENLLSRMQDETISEKTRDYLMSALWNFTGSKASKELFVNEAAIKAFLLTLKRHQDPKSRHAISACFHNLSQV